MAGNGRRTKRPVNPSLTSDGELRGFELPEGSTVLPKGADWHPLAKKIWNDWRKSPQAQRMGTELDWDSLLITMIQLDGALKSGKWGTAAPEIRIRFNQFGDTPAARNALKFDAPGADDLSASRGVGSNVIPMTKVTDWRRQVG